MHPASPRLRDRGAHLSRGLNMEIRVNWRPLPQESDGDTVSLDQVEGIEEEFEALQGAAPGSQVEVQGGGFGKGASATGIALVILVAERVLSDLSALIDIGTALRSAIARIGQRRGDSRPALINVEGLAAIAASYAGQALAGAYYAKTIPLNVSEGVGTDGRDVWLTCFDDPEHGQLHAIFLSPSGLLLGYIRVPVELHYDGETWLERDEEEIARWWSSAGGMP
jgi:hypothetical protein